MAEILGIIGSAIAIVQIGGSIISFCNNFRHALGPPPKEASLLKSDIEALRDTIEDLVKVLGRSDPSQPQFGALQRLGEKDGTLHCCKADLNELNTRLKSTKLKEKVWQSIKWPMTDKEIYKEITRLNNYKNTIALALLRDQT
jgi:hypothetical protein